MTTTPHPLPESLTALQSHYPRTAEFIRETMAEFVTVTTTAMALEKLGKVDLAAIQSYLRQSCKTAVAILKLQDTSSMKAELAEIVDNLLRARGRRAQPEEPRPSRPIQAVAPHQPLGFTPQQIARLEPRLVTPSSPVVDHRPLRFSDEDRECVAAMLHPQLPPPASTQDISPLAPTVAPPITPAQDASPPASTPVVAGEPVSVVSPPAPAPVVAPPSPAPTSVGSPLDQDRIHPVVRRHLLQVLRTVEPFGCAGSVREALLAFAALEAQGQRGPMEGTGRELFAELARRGLVPPSGPRTRDQVFGWLRQRTPFVTTALDGSPKVWRVHIDQLVSPSAAFLGLVEELLQCTAPRIRGWR